MRNSIAVPWQPASIRPIMEGHNLRPMHGDKRSIGLVGAILAAAALALAGCGAAPASGSTSPEAAATALPQAPAASPGTGSASNDSGSTTRQSQGGNVTIGVTLQNPSDATGPLIFSVAMDTHAVNLDNYDLSQLAILRNDRGQEVKPEQWDAPLGGHHRSGTLAFPTTDVLGKPLLGSGTKVVELVIRDVAGVKERVLSWEVSG